MAVSSVLGSRTINELSLMFKGRQINLEPGFQRNSVWTFTDRDRLVQSIFAGYPLPSIFLYKRHHSGRLIYDVIDGKQRLESIFMYIELGRFSKDWFTAQLNLEEKPDWYDWRYIKRHLPAKRFEFESYKLQTVEVEGELGEIIDLFVRINSTGKRLTSGEKRHAKFYRSPFLQLAQEMVDRYHKYLSSTHILSAGQLRRMKGTELFAELLMSIHTGGPINKKTSLDRAIGNDGINRNTLHRLSREFKQTINLARRMFPDLHQTRLRNSAEFYSLFMLIWDMHRSGLVLSDRRRNKMAFELLRRLASGVDRLRDDLRKAQAPRSPERVYQQYLLTVQGDTDSLATRERRQAVLKGLLWSVFEQKDSQRLFSPEQRRVLWHSEERPKCAKCHRTVTWAEFTADHVRAWSRGGETTLRNAKIMHKACNSRKGAR